MNKRMLMTASVPSMISQFNMDNIAILRSMGYEVHVACNFRDRSIWNDTEVRKFIQELREKEIPYFNIDYPRNPVHVASDMKSIRQMEALVRKYHYDFIHCHSPIGGVVARLVGHRDHIPVIYTAHGFHFYDGAPAKNWILFYPVEKALSRYTDILITINHEDYHRAKKEFHAKKTVYIPGVGIDTEKFANVKVDRAAKRKELGVPENAFLLISVGELNENKNHRVVIEAIHRLNDSDIYYIIAGIGAREKEYRKLIMKYGLSNRVKLLGYREDVAELYKTADCYIHPSLREGLPVALMEAMASGLPVICSCIRGCTDLIDEKGGILSDPNSLCDMIRFIRKIMRKDIKKMGQYNQRQIQKYDKKNINGVMYKLYENINCNNSII